MEAGNRCFDQRVPEEINRKIIDHISDINLPYSDVAREYLLREGFPPDRVIKTGSPMFEVLTYYWDKIEASDVLNRLNLKPENYFLVSTHREENIDDPIQFANLVACLNAIAGQYCLRVIVSTHPRTLNRIESTGTTVNSLVEFMKPLGFFDYVHLQTKARATLSDSGTISEESSILNFPALNIRNAHERPEAMEEASVMLTGLEPGRVLQGLDILKTQHRGTERTLRLVADYNTLNVSDKVLRIIVSYTSYVKRYVWHRESTEWK
jgi:UDP-N-acetylglucosamine 2-epimerase (non-hydrolysing)